MIEVSLSLIARDVIGISPKIRLHLDMSRTVGTNVQLIPVAVQHVNTPLA